MGKLKLVRMQVDLVLASFLLLLPLPSIARGAASAAIYYGTRTSGSLTGPGSTSIGSSTESTDSGSRDSGSPTFALAASAGGSATTRSGYLSRFGTKQSKAGSGTGLTTIGSAGSSKGQTGSGSITERRGTGT